MQLYYYILYVYVQIVWPVHNVLDMSLHVFIYVHKQKSLNINFRVSLYAVAKRVLFSPQWSKEIKRPTTSRGGTVTADLVLLLFITCAWRISVHF